MRMLISTGTFRLVVTFILPAFTLFLYGDKNSIMKLTITTLGDEIFTLDVSGDMDLASFKALCEFECGIPSTEIAVLWNGRPLHDDKRNLDDYGIKDGEVVLIQRIIGSRGQSTGSQQAASRPQMPGIPGSK